MARIGAYWGCGMNGNTYPYLNEPARIVIAESLELARKNDDVEMIAFMENASRLLNCEAADISFGEFWKRHGAECCRRGP